MWSQLRLKPIVGIRTSKVQTPLINALVVVTFSILNKLHILDLENRGEGGKGTLNEPRDYCHRQS